jgi:hypothetical protein
MDKDARLMVEAYVDGITKRRGELAGTVMHIVKHGMPTRAEFIKIRHELHRKVKEIQDRGTEATEQEKQEGRRMMGQIKAYRSLHPDDPGSYEDDADGTAATPEVSLQPHGALADVTDVQIKSMNMLKSHGFYINRVSNAHAEQMGGPVAYMGRNTGAMHQVAEIDPQGMINDETPEEYVKNHVHANEDEQGRSRAQQAAIAIALQKAGKKPS